MTRFLSKFSNPHFKKFIFTFLAVIVACIVSYVWLDRPIAIFMAHFHAGTVLANYYIADTLTEFAYCATLLVMAFYAYMRLVSHRSSLLVQTAGGISFAVPVAFFVKTQLQYLFGRIGVRYADSNTLLFVKNPNLYGFKFFIAAGSFPSGHMCVFTASFLIIAFHYPKLKPYTLSLIGLLGFILIFDNYHFLSDVIAGTYLGYIIAKVIYRLET